MIPVPAAARTTTQLTVPERRELARQEAIVERYLPECVATLDALQVIHDQRLYREYGSWEDYCRQRWKRSGRHALRLIGLAEVSRNIENSDPMGPIPTSERQARPMVALSPEQQADVWQMATGNGARPDPTGEEIAEIVRQAVAGLTRDERAGIIIAAAEKQARKDAPAHARAPRGRVGEQFRQIERLGERIRKLALGLPGATAVTERLLEAFLEHVRGLE